MTISERLTQAQQQSVALYLRRQEIEQQAQQVRSAALEIDAELLRLDGEIRACVALSAPDIHAAT